MTTANPIWKRGKIKKRAGYKSGEDAGGGASAWGVYTLYDTHDKYSQSFVYRHDVGPKKSYQVKEYST